MSDYLSTYSASFQGLQKPKPKGPTRLIHIGGKSSNIFGWEPKQKALPVSESVEKSVSEQTSELLMKAQKNGALRYNLRGVLHRYNNKSVLAMARHMP